MSNYQHNISIKTLSLDPEIIIWYASIPQIIESVLHSRSHPDVKQMRNSLFVKNNFLLPFLNSEEIDIINGFKAQKKQMEWMSGRYLVKLMIQSAFLHNTSLEQINIDYLDEGAPFLNSAPEIPISLSHSNNYTAAACSKNRTKIMGIDIEKIGKKPDAWFLKTAFTKKEISHLQDSSASIFKNWTIKEAYLKYIKKGFNESLHNVEVIDAAIWHNKTRINVDIYSTIVDNDYILSLVSN